MDAYPQDQAQRKYSGVAGDASLLGPNAKALRIVYLDAACSKSIVQDADHEDTIYSVEYKFRNPNLRISRPGESNYFGSATMHMFSNKIDVDVRGLGLRLKPTKDLLPNFTYSSPAMHHQTITWESRNHYGYFDLVCLDQSDTPIAWVTTQNWKQNKYGRMEMRGDAWADEATREELLLTGLTLTYQTTMSKTPSYAPAEPKAMGMGSSAISAATSPFANIH